jgi:hypothetical protein
MSQNFEVQYKCNEQNTRHNKSNTRYKTQKKAYTETTKHENKEKATAGI